MSYKITRGRVPTGRSESASKPTKAAAKPHPAGPIQGPPQTPRRKKPHAKPYSVCPPMNSLMIDVGGIAAISSGESATI